MNIHWFAACASFMVYVIASMEMADMQRGTGNLLFLAFSGSPVHYLECGAACTPTMGLGVTPDLFLGSLLRPRLGFLGCLLRPMLSTETE